MRTTARKLDRLDPALLAANPRANVAAWMKYESIVLAAYRQHPKPYIFRPTSMAAVTVCSRLRDAIRGKLAFDYPSEISAEELAVWYGQVVIKSDTEQVLIGPMEEVKASVQGTAVGTTKPTDMVFQELSFEEITAFTLLLSTGRVVGPVLVQKPPDISLLPVRPNVELMNRPDGSLVLL
jgi:hypothetical protein